MYIHYIFLYIYVGISIYTHHICLYSTSSHNSKKCWLAPETNRTQGENTRSTEAAERLRHAKIKRSLTNFLRILGPAMMSSCHHLIILCSYVLPYKHIPPKGLVQWWCNSSPHKTLLDNLSQAAEFSRPGRQNGATNATSINKPTSG